MQYETFAITDVALLPDVPYTNVDECANQISGIYDIAAEHGGQIIATHTFDCNVRKPGQAEEADEVEAVRITSLFFVIEFPDDVDVSKI
jgi:hypothetical protein